MAFGDRQLLLEALSDNIKDKRNLLTRKQIIEVHNHSSGVTVTCSDRTTYDGDILVGADGANSTVRECMWKLADAAKPGSSYKDRKCQSAAKKGVLGYADEKSQLWLLNISAFSVLLHRAKTFSPATLTTDTIKTAASSHL
jgi:hypothetical protein